MTLDQIRSELGAARCLPRAALAAAVEQADALSPLVLELVDLACKHVLLTRPQEKLLFFGIHALAAARRTELYDALLALIRHRSGDLEWLLGDTSLQALLISTCGDAGRAPFDLLEDPAIDGDAKCSLFLLIARLVWEGRTSRAEFEALLDRFDRDAPEEPNDMAWLGWQSAVELLGLTHFEGRMRAGWGAGRMPFDRDVDREAAIAALHQAARNPADESQFAVHGVTPITDLVALLRWTGSLGDDRPREEDTENPEDPAYDIRLTLDERHWLGDFLTCGIAPDTGMDLECLDGFLTALAAGPTDVPREEWWARIWSETGDEDPEYETDAQEGYARTLIERHFEAIRRRLENGYRPRPLVGEDSPADSVETWAFGFLLGTGLRPGSWDSMVWHKQASFAITSIMLLLPPEELGEADEGLQPLDDESRAPIVANLPRLVQMAYAFWHDLPIPPLIESRRSRKVGRNEPCPCGSGRKYKKCCGAASRYTHP